MFKKHIKAANQIAQEVENTIMNSSAYEEFRDDNNAMHLINMMVQEVIKDKVFPMLDSMQF
jgi:5-methylcytosine-specific restriction endonuclease McrBC regulatory subunit McrC